MVTRHKGLVDYPRKEELVDYGKAVDMSLGDQIHTTARHLERAGLSEQAKRLKAAALEIRRAAIVAATAAARARVEATYRRLSADDEDERAECGRAADLADVAADSAWGVLDHILMADIGDKR